MTRVQVQCTLSEIIINFSMQLFPNGILFFLLMYIAPCEKRKRGEDEPNSGVQQCRVHYWKSCKMYPLDRNLQHVVYQDWMGGTQ